MGWTRAKPSMAASPSIAVFSMGSIRVFRNRLTALPVSFHTQMLGLFCE
jgi:hypothetical protein